MPHSDMPLQTVRESLHLLGYLNARYGRPERAEGYFELLVVVDALNPVAWRALATVQLMQEKNPEALASATKALELEALPGERRLCHLVQASACRRLGDLQGGDAAVAAFLAAKTGSSD
jgi:tetratricopeptide (TPR) repeat protein